MCYFLVAAAVGAFLYLVFTSDSLDNMSTQKQIDLLNDATISGNVKSGCQSTLIIMRHCEFTTAEDAEVLDEEGNQHCSATGLARADFFPSLFGHGGRWPLPAKLYAMKRDRQGVREKDDYSNYREIETLNPLGDKAEIDIDSSFSDGGERQLALEYFDDLGLGDYCDKSVVVSWKVQRIVTLAQALGCGEHEGCPDKFKKRDFDKVSLQVLAMLGIYLFVVYNYVLRSQIKLSSKLTFRLCRKIYSNRSGNSLTHTWKWKLTRGGMQIVVVEKKPMLSEC